MQTSFHHLPAPVRERLELALDLIKVLATPEKVILLSQPHFSYYKDTKEPPAPYLDRLNFLVILAQAQNHQRSELQEKLESSCRLQGVRINVLIHTTDQVNRMFSENPYLFPELQKEGILLHDTGTSTFTTIPPSCPKEQSILAGQHFDRWFSLARAFFSSAQFSLFRKELPLAAFLLHQSLEHGFTAVHLVFTGYRPTTHNLDKMRRYTSRFSAALASVFPRHTDEETHLFHLLKTAYSRARYANDYDISEKECHILLSRVRKILLIARCICRNRIISLQSTDQAFTNTFSDHENAS